MLKYILLEGLYEEIEGAYDESKADEIDNNIRASKLGKVWDNEYAIAYIFSSENESKLLEIIPKFVYVGIRDFKDFIEGMAGYGYMGDFKFGNLTIDGNEVLDFLLDEYKEINIEDRLMNNEKPIHDEFDMITKEIVELKVDEELAEIRLELSRFMKE